MPSERAQRRIDRLLDDAEQAMDQRDWDLVRQHVQDVLDLDPNNADALDFLAAMERKVTHTHTHTHTHTQAAPVPGDTPGESPALHPSSPALLPQGEKGDESATPSSFDAGRYVVKGFLGEGGKKKVYLAHDKMLDRDVAFALIKAEGLDDVGRLRVSREAQAMGRLGSHPHIVTVFDFGTLPPLPPGEGGGEGAPFMVTELMGGGDVESVIEKAPDHKLPLEQALHIGEQVCQGLEYAHSQNIVHRDLKPGNVWLTEAIGSRQSAVGDGVGTGPTIHG